MPICKISLYLAHFAALYIGASLFYLFRTKFFSDIGTPFNDTLTEKQRYVKMKSTNTRAKVFFQGFIGTAILLWICKPFDPCSSNSLNGS